MVVQQKPSRGRPRSFDVEAALAAGRRLFHAHGYAAVGLAARTAALGIGPASFYAAFGSKAAFFERILDGYMREVMPLSGILRSDRPMAEAIDALLMTAARTYAADPERLGCLVLEALRADRRDEGRIAAERVTLDRRATLEAYVAATDPALAVQIADIVTTTMAGLSAAARDGLPRQRLEQVAAAASHGIRALL